jgi:hypothetical protein
MHEVEPSKPFLKQYTRALLWAAFILAACGASPGTFKTLHLTDLFSYDKPIHAILFGVQAWLIIRANYVSGQASRNVVIVAGILAATYGAAIEVMQLFWFEGREFDYYDMIADGFGVVVVLAWKLRRRV